MLFDSGIRSGADIVKALALGATAVGIGRPYAYGLALGGVDGVVHVLRSLLAEADLIMAVDGYPTSERPHPRSPPARQLSRRAPVCHGRRVEAILEEFDEYLALERGRSDHTRRAYLGDLRSLFEFLAQRAPDAQLTSLSLPVLRSWLAAQASAGVGPHHAGAPHLGGQDLHRLGDPAGTAVERSRHASAGAQDAANAARRVASGSGAGRHGRRQFRCTAR